MSLQLAYRRDCSKLLNYIRIICDSSWSVIRHDRSVQQSQLVLLPREIYVEIVGHLSERDKLNLGLTCTDLLTRVNCPHPEHHTSPCIRFLAAEIRQQYYPHCFVPNHLAQNPAVTGGHWTNGDLDQDLSYISD
jgi:hypothetical protein